MTRDTRALLRNSERKILTGEKEPKGSYERVVRHNIRKRIDNELVEDLEILHEHRPELFGRVVEKVEQETESDDSTVESSALRE